MKFLSQISRLARNARGSSIVEFAAVAPVFILVISALIEFGLMRYYQTAVETIAMQAARTASLGDDDPDDGCDRVCIVENEIREKASALHNGDQIEIAAGVVSGETGPTSPPDICHTTPNPSSPSTCPTGTNWTDVNGNGVYDAPGAMTLGGAGDLIEIRVSYPYTIQVPVIGQFFGNDGVISLSSTAVVQNEQFPE